MQIIPLLLALLLPSSLSTYAGWVTFSNVGAPGRIINSLTGQPVEAGSTFQVALYYADDGITNENEFRQNGASVGFIFPGLFSGGTRVVPPPAYGGYAMFQVRCWDAASGSSYHEALVMGGLIGKSGILRVDTAIPPEPTASLLSASAVVGPPLRDGFVVKGPMYSISGVISYAGRQLGDIWIIGSTWPQFTERVLSIRIAVPAPPPFIDLPFLIADLTPTNYWLMAFLDSDGDATYDPIEPRWVYPDNGFFLYGDRTDVVIVLADPDSDDDGLIDVDELYVYGTDLGRQDTDGDGMLDAWEVAHGLTPVRDDRAEDRDLDGVSNFVEYQKSLNPLRADSLNDGTNDYQRIFGTVRPNAFHYDRIDRLIGAEYGRGLSIAYIYDGNGNILRQVHMQRDANTNGLPDLWEFLNGLTNSTLADTYSDPDGDGWSNFQEWKVGSSPNNAGSRPDVLGMEGISIASLQLPFTPSNFVVGVGQLDGVGAEEIVIGADGDPGTNTNCILILSQTTGGWATQRVDIGPVGITSIGVGSLRNTASAAAYIGTRQMDGTGTVMEVKLVGDTWQKTALSIGNTGRVAYVLGVRANLDVLASLSTTNALGQTLFSVSFANNVWFARLISTNSSHRGLGTVAFTSTNDAIGTSLRLLDRGGIELWANAGAVDTQALVAQYPFDGSTIDMSDNHNDGTIHGALVPTPDRFDIPNGSLRFFGGTNDFVRVPDSDLWAFGTDDFSVTLWVNFSEVTRSTRSILIGTSPQGGAVPKWLFEYGAFGPNDLSFHFVTSGGSPAYPVHAAFMPETNHWYHLAVTRRADAYSLYVDGNLVHIGTNSSALENVDADLSIGNAIPRETQYGFRGMIDDVRIYHRALGAQEILTDVQSPVHAEPMASNRLLWRGRSLDQGFPRATCASSILYSFVDDKNTNNFVDSRDHFIVTEFQWAAARSQNLTLSNVLLSDSSLAQSYGLTSVRLISRSNEFLFTGEPNGEVFAWVATNGFGQLHRQLFSPHHSGKAWHALTGVKTLEPGEGLVGLRVNPATPQNCDVIFWPPQWELPKTPQFPQTAPITRIMPEANTLTGICISVRVRIWDAEGNACLPMLQFRPEGSPNWLEATISYVDGVAVTNGLRIAALPSGSDHTLTWDPPDDIFPPGTTTNVWLQARAKDVTLLGDWSPAERITIHITPDSDSDHLPDAWEYANFGNLTHDAAGDFDGDFFTNHQEYIADTNPNDPDSYLRLTITLLPADQGPLTTNKVRIQWLAGPNSTQYLQRRFTLDLSNDWSDILTSPPSLKAYIENTATNVGSFYRVRAER